MSLRFLRSILLAIACDQEVLLTEPAGWPVSSAKRLDSQYAHAGRSQSPNGRSEAEDPP
jgi:hypothetical protein